MATSTRFDFFGLPPELRDMVYTDLLSDEIDLDLEETYKAKVVACDVPRLSLLLVNRQFGSELQNCATHRSVLTIEDHCDASGITYLKPTLPGSTCRLQQLRLKLLLSCDGHAANPSGDKDDKYCILRDVEVHEKWIRVLLPQMTQLRTVAVELYLERYPSVSLCEKTLLDNQSKLTTLENTVSCDVYHIESSDIGRNYDQDKKLVMALNKETASLQRIHEMKQGNGDGK